MLTVSSAFGSAILLALTAQAASAQYLGSEACRSCHPRESAAQAKSGHARALAPAPPGSAGQWAFGAGAQAITYVSQIDRDGYVEHGLSYYAASKALALTPGHPTKEDKYYRTFDPDAGILRCFQCHSTGPLKLEAKDAIQPFESGVHCESCHGPGAEHVKSGGAKGALRNPKQLTAAGLNEFCGACHRQPPAAGDSTDWTNPWNVRHQPLYLSQSACFRKSGGALSCLTCHDPHTELSRSPAAYDQRCAACHPKPRHLTAVAGRACAGCHMPRVASSALLSFTNHWIR